MLRRKRGERKEKRIIENEKIAVEKDERGSKIRS